MADRVLVAEPFLPVTFSGDAPIMSRRHSALVKDFNVIFDPQYVRATPTIADDKKAFDVEVANGMVEAILFVEEGKCNGIPLPPHALAIVAEAAERVTCEGRSIRVTISPQGLA